MSEAMLQHLQIDRSTAESATFRVIAHARRITDAKNLDFLEYRKHVGIPLATAILREWLPLQPPGKPVWLDFRGVRAINLSVAEELGPILMKHVAEQALSAYPKLNLYLFLGKANISNTIIVFGAKMYKNNFA